MELPKLVGAISGSGRLRARLLKDEAGTTLGYAGRPSSLFQEAQGNRDCESVQFESGLRCMPRFIELPAGHGLFSDATCTTPLVVCSGDDCRSVVYAESVSMSCSPASFSGAYSPDTRYHGKRYVKNGLGACVKDVNPPELAPAWTRRPVDLEPFAKLELVDEPLLK